MGEIEKKRLPTEKCLCADAYDVPSLVQYYQPLMCPHLPPPTLVYQILTSCHKHTRNFKERVGRGRQADMQTGRHIHAHTHAHARTHARTQIHRHQRQRQRQRQPQPQPHRHAHRRARTISNRPTSSTSPSVAATSSSVSMLFRSCAFSTAPAAQSSAATMSCLVRRCGRDGMGWNVND